MWTLTIAVGASVIGSSRLAHATFPGKNGKVAYTTAGNQIYLTGSGQLTSPGQSYDFTPAFSPDGSQITFVRQTSENSGYFYQVMVVKADDGLNLHEVVNSGQFPGLTAFSSIGEPSWSNDGRISFVVRNGTADQNGIWTIGGRAGLTRSVADPFVSGLNWSPIDKELVYACVYRKDELNQDKSDLCIYDDAKNSIRQLPIDWPGQGHGSLGSPKWTPNGERILFAMPYSTMENGHSVGRSDIFAINADGGGLTKLTDSGPDICPGYDELHQLNVTVSERRRR